MGNQANLCHMLGAPDELLCPECKQTFRTYFDDYDIDSDSVNPEPGVWVLRTGCPHCESSMRLEFTVAPRLKEGECSKSPHQDP